MRVIYPIVASIAGAVTALSFRPFKELSRAEIGMALFVGASFATFVGPWVVRVILGNGPNDIRLQAGIFYLMASGSNALIPMAVKWLGRVFNPKGEAE